MTRRLIGLAAALAVAVFAAACDSATPTAPQANDPLFAKAPPPFACTFTGNPSLSNSANAYFTSAADRKTAADFIAAMQAGFTAGSYSGARGSGFDLLSFTGKVSRGAGAGDSANGGALVRQAVQCMFDVEANNDDATEDFFGWPSDEQFDFGRALTSAAGGALYVRGGPADSATYPVIARGTAGNISGIAPAGVATWPNTLSNRVLIYGEPVTGGYDWKLIPRTTSFSPSAVVALCQAVQPVGGFGDDAMIDQESVGVLGFVGAQAATICGQTPSEALRGGSLGSFALLGRLVRFADRLLAPQPLYASSALVASSTIGGSASGAKGDPFTSLSLPDVTLSFSSPGVPPPANIKVNTRFSLEVNVSTPDGEPAGGITVALSAQTNNGTGTGIFQVLPSAPAQFVCDPSQSYIKPGAPTATTLGTVGVGGVSQPTNAKWNNNLCWSKTGSVYVFGASTADGRTGGIGSVKSNKVNVKP